MHQSSQTAQRCIFLPIILLLPFKYSMKFFFLKSYAVTLLLLLLNSVVLIFALAYPPNPNRIIETWLFSVILHRYFPRCWHVLMWFSAFLILLYHPTAVHYGRPSFGIVASLLSTTATEVSEYISTISWQTYLITIVLAIIPLLIVHLSRKTPRPHWRTRWAIFLVVVLVVMSMQTARKGYTIGGFALRAQPIEFLADAYLQPRAYFAELNKLKEDLNKPDQWNVTQTQHKFKNYILIIGESARADYLHLYGFKYPNTPFLDSHANTIMDNMLSAGPNTPISLLHSLTLSDGKLFTIQNNIITLAKKAGMETVWLSNQGALGQYDTSISTIAYHADQSIFLKKTGYDFGKKSYDDQLIPPLEKVLTNPLSANKSRLIVLHIMGSHPNPCDRLPQPPHHYVENHNTNCYIDTIWQTDLLLKQIYTALKKTGQPFSMFYFSDHGLSHDKNTYEKNSFVRASSILRHNDHFYQNYHIPLVVINSDQNTQTRIKARRSGLELIDGVAFWLGITSPQLLHSKQFFSNSDSQAIHVLNMNQQLQSPKQLENDPLPDELR